MSKNNEILCLLKVGVTESAARAAAENLGLTVLKISSNGRLTSVLIEVSDLDTSMHDLEKTGCFEALQPNRLSRHDV